MKTKLFCLIAAVLAIVVSGCAVQTVQINKHQTWPGGSLTDHSTNSGIDVAGGAYHQEVVRNDMSETNTGGYSSSDQSTAKKTSINIPFITPVFDLLEHIVGGFFCCLANGAEVCHSGPPGTVLVYQNSNFGGYGYNGGYEYQDGPGFVAPLVLVNPTGGWHGGNNNWHGGNNNGGGNGWHGGNQGGNSHH